MSIIQQPAYIITILLLLVVFSEWLASKKFFSHIGSPLLIILAGAILANLNIIPTSHNATPLYDGIFQYAAPLGIFFLLLEVKLKDLKLAGLPMIMMFLIGSAATMAGAIIGYKIFSPQHHGVHLAYAVAGMYTGTYTGGSANLNAVAITYGVNKDGTLFAAINAVDSIVTTIWLMMTLVLPSVLQKFIPQKTCLPDRHGKIPAQLQAFTDEELRQRMGLAVKEIKLAEISLLLALGFGALFLSAQVTNLVPQVPSILVLTTIALILAQFSFIQKISGGKILGLLLIMLFLAVVGAYCDMTALLKSGPIAGLLLTWVSVMVFIHGFLIFGIGGLLKQDWDIISIASNANIGGATSAPVCATSLGRQDLQLPGLLAGSVGNAIGTFLGLLVAEILK